MIITRLLRAENGTRTRDLNLGKVVLYQLSYFRRSGWFPIASAKVVKSRSLQIFRSLFYGFLFGEGSEFRYPAHVRRSPQHVAGAGTRQYPPPSLFIPISCLENERSVAYGFVPSPVVRRKVTYCYPVRRSAVTTNRTIDRTNRVVFEV